MKRAKSASELVLTLAEMPAGFTRVRARDFDKPNDSNRAFEREAATTMTSIKIEVRVQVFPSAADALVFMVAFRVQGKDSGMSLGQEFGDESVAYRMTKRTKFGGVTLMGAASRVSNATALVVAVGNPDVDPATVVDVLTNQVRRLTES